MAFLQRILGHTSIAATMRYVKLAGVDVKLDQYRTSLANAWASSGSNVVRLQS